MPHRATLTVLFVGAFLALAVAFVLYFDNPTVNVTASDINDSGPAGKVDCTIAPWDAALNDNDDGPGGEHTEAFHDEVAVNCYSANTRRFRASVGSGVLGLILLSGGVAAALRPTRTASTP